MKYLLISGCLAFFASGFPDSVYAEVSRADDCPSLHSTGELDADRGDVVFTRSDLELFVEKWQRRDGIAAGVISDYFCDFALYNLPLFLEVMNGNRVTFGEWLDGLPSASFVDYGGCIDLECKRAAMLKMLRIVRVPDALEELRLRLLSRLENLEVRAIE